MLYIQIAHNKRNTWLVLLMFLLLVLAVAGVIQYFFSNDLGLIFLAAGLIYLFYVYFYATRHLMKVTNAVEIHQEGHPEIYEMVEELCLAGGIPVPKIYITPDEDPNAFATGRDPEHASLALTKGLLAMMDKRELQGVIGHELSHIRNYDIRVTTIASGLVNLIAKTGVGILAFGWALVSNDGRGWLSLALRLFGIFIAIVGGIITVIGIPLAKLLFFAVSRQREYLADAGSVDLTREPSGLISALTKLQKMEVAPVASNDAMLDSLRFNGPLKTNFFSQMFADHPALTKRIDRLKNSAQVKS